jgi:pyruvate dehydrogenase E2 component (dihydrolipoamide acetyltransferase)
VVTEVVLPQMGLEVAEGVVLALPVEVGQAVAEGDVVAEVETDKAIAEVPAPRAGVITAIEVSLEDTIPIGTVIVRIGDSADEVGEPATVPMTEPTDAEAAVDAIAAGDPVGARAPADVIAPASNGATSTTGKTADGRRFRAAPIARRAAAANGIDLQLVTGTGPSGRITLGDVERAIAAGDQAPARETPAADTPNETGGGRLEPLSATRQSIARRLSESQLVPQYTLSREIDAGWLLAEKQRLSAAGPVKIGVLDLLLAALAETISRHRTLAASFVPGRDGEPPSYRHPEAIDLGVAVATDRGLLVPVIRGADGRTLSELVLERSRLVDLTRAGRLGPADMGGAAATLSSLGTFGVDSFTAMLNPGESAILAAGRAVEKLVPRERGVAVAPLISLTFTFDHRVVDGAVGGAALSELADLLEGSIEWRL